MIRKVIYAIIFGLTIFFVIRNYEELVIIIQTLSRAEPGWLLAAVVAQLFWIAAIAGNLQSTYHLTGLRETLRHMFALTVAGNFVNVVAPSYGAGAMAVFIADGQQRDKPAGKITTASFLYLVYDYLGFMIVLSVGIVLMKARGLLGPAIIGASIFACTIGVSLVIAAVVGIFSSDHLDRLVVWVVRGINRLAHPFIKKELIDLGNARGFGADIASGLMEIRRSPGNLLQPIGWALGRKTMMMVILYLVSRAY
ncbi:MAG: lysylphosphatidylglycerol synthase domain-containing protein, partial [Anaerolineales bacterium]